MPAPARTPVDRQTEKRYRPSMKPAMEARSAKGSIDTAFHTRNFLDCVKSSRKCNRDVPERRRPTAATRIANIAYKTRSYLEWDGAAERFRNGEGANRVLEYKYRAPYKLR